jgi:hypothetical protein
MKTAVLSAATVLLLSASASAQDDSALVAFGKKAIALFQEPVHPVVTTVAPRGWLGAGVGYNTTDLWETRGFASLEGVFTIRQYWSTHANLGIQSDRYRVETYARARDMKRLDLYGLGSDAPQENRTTFRLRNSEVGGLGSIRFGAVAIGGRVESLWPDVRAGQNHDYPSVEERFTEQTLPGLTAQPRFSHYQSFVNVNYPYNLNARGSTGGDYRLAFSHFHDGGQTGFSFRRFTVEIQQRLRGLRDRQRLTLHGLFTTTGTPDDNAVPFYFQETLGGAGAVRGFNDEIIGTDGTKATLRGFDDLRFRGPHSLLLQAEYRWNVWGPVDVTAFVDAGKTALARGDLDLTDMKHDVGASISAMTGNATAMRVDFGFGGGEGAHVFFTIGPIFAR